MGKYACILRINILSRWKNISATGPPMSFPTNIPAAALDVASHSPAPHTPRSRQRGRRLRMRPRPSHARRIDPQSVPSFASPPRPLASASKALQSSPISEPGITPEKLDSSLKWACSLSRSSHQAQRRLTELQRSALIATAEPANPNAPKPFPHYPQPSHLPHNPKTTTQPPTSPKPRPRWHPLPTPELMMSHHKGAPPPHSSAAQQI